MPWRSVLLVPVLVALLPVTAAAQYLDPGSGSMLLQGLIALIGGAVVTVGVYWRAIRERFRALLRRGPPPGPDGGHGG